MKLFATISCVAISCLVSGCGTFIGVVAFGDKTVQKRMAPVDESIE